MKTATKTPRDKRFGTDHDSRPPIAAALVRANYRDAFEMQSAA